MSSNWNEELDKYESGRSFGDDLRDSITTACSAVSLIVSKLPDSKESHSEYKSSVKFSWEKEGFFRHKDGF